MGIDTQNKVNLRVMIAGLELKNPVMTASGTFGSGKEYSNLIDITKLGALVTKAVTKEARPGNPLPRISEAPSGMLNAIGLQNKGVRRFLVEDLEHLNGLDLPVIVNVAGDTMDDYIYVAETLSQDSRIKALEINISCPNVKKGGVAFGYDPLVAADLTRKIRKATSLPLIVKLTPNTPHIESVAQAVEEAGADGVSLINTLIGMAIDVDSFKPALANITGGLSGPAIKPIALAMVFRVARRIKIPIIGMGGIMTANDAIEFILAGASAVAVGTANFVNPRATLDIILGIKDYMRAKGVLDVKELIGAVKI